MGPARLISRRKVVFDENFIFKLDMLSFIQLVDNLISLTSKQLICTRKENIFSLKDIDASLEAFALIVLTSPLR